MHDPVLQKLELDIANNLQHLPPEMCRNQAEFFARHYYGLRLHPFTSPEARVWQQRAERRCMAAALGYSWRALSTGALALLLFLAPTPAQAGVRMHLSPDPKVALARPHKPAAPRPPRPHVPHPHKPHLGGN